MVWHALHPAAALVELREHYRLAQTQPVSTVDRQIPSSACVCVLGAAGPAAFVVEWRQGGQRTILGEHVLQG